MISFNPKLGQNSNPISLFFFPAFHLQPFEGEILGRLKLILLNIFNKLRG